MFKIYKIGELGDQTIRTIVEIKDKIDFFPVYQRYGNIWDNYKKKLLIDTILNGFDIPKFYFNYFVEQNNPLNKNNKIYAVIDGKQRLQAIIDFIDNKFSLNNDFEYFDNPKIELRNLSYQQIAQSYPEVISKFWETNLDIVFVSTDDEDKLEELFLRLNGGEALTNSEKRNAIGGYFNEKIRQIVEENDFFTNRVRFRNPRYQHQDLLTKIIFIESNNHLISLKNTSLNEFVRNNRVQSPEIDNLIGRVLDNLEILSQIFESKDTLLRGKGVIPVYYYYITRQQPNGNLFKNFLIDFEESRQINKRLDEQSSNPILVEYDRLNQQAVHTEKSLLRRYEIIEKLFNTYKTTNIIVPQNLDLDELDSDENGNEQ